VFNETWDGNQLNPTCSRRISLLSTPRPQVQVNNNDILLMVGLNYNIKHSIYWVSLLEMQDDIILSNDRHNHYHIASYALIVILSWHNTVKCLSFYGTGITLLTHQHMMGAHTFNVKLLHSYTDIVFIYGLKPNIHLLKQLLVGMVDVNYKIHLN